VLVSPDTGGRIAVSHGDGSRHGFVYMPTREGSVSMHAPEKIWKFICDLEQRRHPNYEGPLIEELAPLRGGRQTRRLGSCREREVWT